MKNKLGYLFCIACLGGTVSANGDSLLQPASFPKTFVDVDFQTRMDVLSAGYNDLGAVYDTQTGRCISGCAYSGITIEDETAAIERNSRRANNVINSYGLQQNVQPSSTLPIPEIPTVVDLESDTPISIPDVPVSTPSVIPQTPQSTNLESYTCLRYHTVKQNAFPINSPIANDITITSDFGPRERPKDGATIWHRGIDISVPTGTPVYATGNGKIERIWTDPGGGKSVRVKHIDGFYTDYYHLSDNNVMRIGDTVQAGCMIGLSGNTGNSTGPHLHYAIFYAPDGKQLNTKTDHIDPLWTRNYLDTKYRFKSQSVKSCLHNPASFCSGQSASGVKPTETLPGEIR